MKFWKNEISKVKYFSDIDLLWILQKFDISDFFYLFIHLFFSKVAFF